MSVVTQDTLGEGNLIEIVRDLQARVKRLETTQGAGTGSSANKLAYYTDNSELVGPAFRITDIGGYAVLLQNETGAASVAGKLLRADTAVNYAVILSAANEEEAIGVFLEDNVPDGDQAWVVIYGPCDVLLDENTDAARGNWAEAGTAGYVNCQNGAPVVARHWQEVGHCMETVDAGGPGTWQTVRITMHFN